MRPPQSDPAVAASRLSMRFGTFTAVDDISFAVERGEVFGFLGANGAGKTTTIRMLCGLLVPTSGTIRVAGFDGATQSMAIKGQVGYMSQRFTLYADLTVAENLAFTAGLRKLSPETLQRRTRELFAFVGFKTPPNTRVADLPAGVKQQLSLVAALLHDPAIIFLDEPTAGVAPQVRERFWELIAQLARQGKTLFVTTHYLDEAEHCDRIALMDAGRIIALDSPDRLKTQTFSEPLIELEAARPEAHAWLETHHPPAAVATMQPHGLRFHVLVLQSQAWKKWLQGAPPGVHATSIRPSLEDVFLRLVEGGKV